MLRVATPTPLDLLLGFPIPRKAIFYRQLATMVNAAMPLAAALEAAGCQTMPQLGSRMAGMVGEGNMLSHAMRCFPFYFSAFEVSLISTGELSGTLDRQLNSLADQMEKSHRLEREITSKLVYPLLILHAAVFIPPVVVLFTQGMQAYLTVTLSLLLPIYLLALVFFSTYRLVASGSWTRKLLDTALMHLPVLGRGVRSLAAARFLDALARLYEAGITPDQSLALATDACGNSYFADRLRSAHKIQGDCELISATLKRSHLFSVFVVSLIATGEESGQTPEMIGRTAQMLHEELTLDARKLMTLFPLLILLLVGGLVGGLVISSYLSLARMFLSI
ncbi:MAG: type II secretion system F family protein [Armatimonadetes bacterium]|nr:type II secretion system F family protein [Armatimonadota bacterium]